MCVSVRYTNIKSSHNHILKRIGICYYTLITTTIGVQLLVCAHVNIIPDVKATLYFVVAL